MASSLIEFNTEWRLVPTTCEPCTGCEDIIYGKQYQLFLNGNPVDAILCEPCKQAQDNLPDEDFEINPFGQ